MAPPPKTPEKGMSSRLLTMKFMQRAAASASSAGVPSSEERSSKRRKVGQSSSGTAPDEVLINNEAITAAIQEQEAVRQAALAKHSADALDTHWVLDVPLAASGPAHADAPLRVEYVGYGDIDSSELSPDDRREVANGRKTTENYKKVEKQEPSDADSADQGSSDEESDDGSNDGKSSPRSSSKTPSRDPRAGRPTDGASARDRLNKRKRAEADKAREFREKRRKKEVKLSGLVSISGAGASSSAGNSSLCYVCQKPGHRAANCPRRSENNRKAVGRPR